MYTQVVEKNIDVVKDINDFPQNLKHDDIGMLIQTLIENYQVNNTSIFVC